MLWLLLGVSVWAQEKKEIDHSYKPLTLKLNDDGSKYVRFIIWHQQWLQTGNLAAEDSKLQLTSFARRSRFLAFAQISPRFLILTHIGLNNLGPGNMTPLGNGPGTGATQFFLHDAWGEFKITPNSNKLYVGTGLHYWKGLTRLANQSTLNFMTMDNTRPFVHWHSLGVTDQFARHFGVYAKGQLGKFEYRVAANNPMNPRNALGAGRHFGSEESDLTYDGSGGSFGNADRLTSDEKPTGYMIVEGYGQYSIFDKESDKLPYKVGTYLGSKKILNIGAGFFAHPNGMYNTATNEHENVTHLAVDAFLDMPLSEGDCLNAYASIMNFNYGDNYVSRWAGTGTVFYGQVGYKLPKLPVMPYVSLQMASYDGMAENISEFNFGVNYYISGHNAKLTLEYHQITNDIREASISDFGDNNRNSQIRLQMHIFL